MNTDIYSTKYPIIVDDSAFLPRYEHRQVKFPRSRRKRIRRKWAKDRRNWRMVLVEKPEAYIVDFNEKRCVIVNQAAERWMRNSIVANRMIPAFDPKDGLQFLPERAIRQSESFLLPDPESIRENLGKMRDRIKEMEEEADRTMAEECRIIAEGYRIPPPLPWNGITVPNTLFSLQDEQPGEVKFPLIDFGRSAITGEMVDKSLVRANYE